MVDLHEKLRCLHVSVEYVDVLGDHALSFGKTEESVPQTRAAMCIS